MPRLKPAISHAFIVSLIIHGIIVFVMSVYLISWTLPFDDLIYASLLKPAELPKLNVKKLMVKPITQPLIPPQSTVVVEHVRPTSRVTTTANRSNSHLASENGVQFSHRLLKLESRLYPQRPKIIDSYQAAPNVVAHVEFPTADVPEAVAFSAPVSHASGSMAQFSQRGIGGVQTEVQLEKLPKQQGFNPFSALQMPSPPPSIQWLMKCGWGIQW